MFLSKHFFDATIKRAIEFQHVLSVDDFSDDEDQILTKATNDCRINFVVEGSRDVLTVRQRAGCLHQLQSDAIDKDLPSLWVLRRIKAEQLPILYAMRTRKNSKPPQIINSVILNLTGRYLATQLSPNGTAKTFKSVIDCQRFGDARCKLLGLAYLCCLHSPYWIPALGLNES
ncbi:hypothetical protein ACO0K7_00805 [Undibacterium sp. Ji67W]|uniref:hypothetical protein n=1 Tax=Undibacterium sp. Ji67W TaxID=3413042 RepID=UPI003BEFBDF6